MLLAARGWRPRRAGRRARAWATSERQPVWRWAPLASARARRASAEVAGGDGHQLGLEGRRIGLGQRSVGTDHGDGALLLTVVFHAIVPKCSVIRHSRPS